MASYQHSTIKLYSTTGSANWGLIPGRFLVIDNITGYLSQQTSTTINNFQYIKPELEISITCDLSQTYAEPLHVSYKYVSIVNSDSPSQTYYYFVKKVTWRAKSAVRLDLVMDVLNTFKENTYFEFKESTRIIREHKNRFKVTSIEIKFHYNTISDVGHIDINEVVPLINVDQDNEHICDVRLIGFDDDYQIVTVEVIDGSTLSYLKDKIENAVNYGDHLLLYKDSSNYMESAYDTVDFDGVIYRDIDYIPENINPILQCGNAPTNYIGDKDKSLLAKDWYLVYRNQNDPSESQATSLVNPVDCYLVPSPKLQLVKVTSQVEELPPTIFKPDNIITLKLHKPTKF